MQDLQIRCIVQSECTLGEGPVWDDVNQDLYWVDILENKIFRYDPASESVDWWKTPEHVGFLIPRENGLIAGLKTGLHHIDFRNNHRISVNRIDRINEGKDHIRFNDGTCDDLGRIWGCTMDMHQKEALGKYYCYDVDMNRRVVDEDYVVANGPALSPDGQCLYTVETVGGAGHPKGIYASSIGEGNRVGEKELLVDWRNRSTFPDGIITDAEGNVWVGEFGGNIVRCFTDTGREKKEITIPAWNVTKPAFGGPSGDVLYVTTARYGADEHIIEKYPDTGGVFEIRGFDGRG